jgi:opacity protein-like surface antigen
VRKLLVLAIGAVILGSGTAMADCKAEVDAAFSKLRESKGFRLETKIVNEQQGSLTMSVDYILPDRMHQRVSLGDSATKMEMIAVGDKAWSNQGQGWAEVPKNFAEVITKQMKETIAAPTKSTAAYDCLGEQEFEGKKYAAYRSSLSLQPEEKAKAEAATPDAKPSAGVQTVYIDKASGLPVRNVVTKADAADKRLFDGTFSVPADLDIKPPADAK